MNNTSLFIALAALTAACASPRAAPTPDPQDQAPCPTADTTAGAWIASIFIDGEAVARRLPAKREQEFPETFALLGDDPPALASLAADRIDLIQFVRGADAEAEYRLCPGEVAMLITTRRPASRIETVNLARERDGLADMGNAADPGDGPLHPEPEP